MKHLCFRCRLKFNFSEPKIHDLSPIVWYKNLTIFAGIRFLFVDKIEF